MADVVSVVEAGYRLDLGGAAWLREVVRAAEPHLFDSLGGIAAFFDRDAAVASILHEVTNFGADEELVGALRAAFESGSDAERDRSLRQGGPVLRLSQLAETRLADNPFYGALARRIGFSDVVVVRALNAGGSGAFFAAPIRPRTRRGAAFVERWSLASAHLCAGLRLQRAMPAPSAVLAPDGRVLDLAPGAETARDTLRRAAIAIDRARARRVLDGWNALVDGRWSLVDHFESDGKRHVLALENAPSVPDPRALAPEERPILHLVAMGHANKLIAYELGLPQGTVATRVKAILRKLGVRSRTELVDRYIALTQMEFARTPDGLIVGSTEASAIAAPELTVAEREVTLLARRGLSNQEIADRRTCSTRTVANLLAAAFRKLGVRSRSELVLRGGFTFAPEAISTS